MNQAHCPFCDFTAGSRGSVKAHITRKTDESHKGKSGPDYGEEIEVSDDSDETSDERSDSESGTEPETGSGGGVVPPEHRSPSQDSDNGSDSCCDNPSLEGNRGEMWEVDGDTYLLEGSDRVCTNCDTLHEGE